MKLVLTLVEFLRGLMERQAIRRMEGGTARFGIPPEEPNLDLGPLGRLR